MLDKGKQNNTEILCDINKQDTAEVFNQRYEKYRLLVENATVPMVHYAPDGRFLFMNTFAARNLGSQPEAFVGTSLYDLCPRMADEIQKRNRKMMKTGAAQKYEDAVELPTGTRWFSSVATPLSGENGKVFAFQVISLDITRLKRNGNGSSHFADHEKTTVNEIVDNYANLTAREREVFKLAAEGCTRTLIAQKLFISPRTAEAHRASAMRKLGLHGRSDLIRYAIQRGIIPVEN